MIDKDKIRLSRRSYNVDGRYWYKPEILIKTKCLFFSCEEWITPYFVNYKTLETDYKIDSINPHNEYGLKNIYKNVWNGLINMKMMKIGKL